MTRRKTLLIVWLLSIIGSGTLTGQAFDSGQLGWAVSLALLAISLGVPLMRAFTEHSK